MATRLVDAGHDVCVWNRTPGSAAAVVERGASEAGSPAEAAGGAEVVMTMLAGPDALEAVVFGPDGLAEGMARHAALVDMSTVGPDAVRSVEHRLPAGVDMLDAPVLGSVPQATEGTLKIFVGGPEPAFERLRPVLDVLGTPRYLGPIGAGAAMKLVANSTLGALMCGLAEALAVGDALGLDEAVMLDILADSPIGTTVRSKRTMIERGEYPPNFALALAAKDLRLVTGAAHDAGLRLRLAPAARDWLEQADAEGLGGLDYSAVIAEVRGRPARPAAPT